MAGRADGVAHEAFVILGHPFGCGLSIESFNPRLDAFDLAMTMEFVTVYGSKGVFQNIGRTIQNDFLLLFA